MINEPHASAQRRLVLDEFMPVYDHLATQSIVIQASPSDVLRALKSMTIGEIPLVRSLVRLQTVTSFVGLGRPQQFDAQRGFIDLARSPESPWVWLGERADSEYVIGAIGIFHRPNVLMAPIRSPEHFRGFGDRRFTRLALGYRVLPGDDTEGSCTLRQECRIHVPDERQRRWFGYYWSVTRGPESIMARGALNAIKYRAEHGVPREPVDWSKLRTAAAGALGAGVLALTLSRSRRLTSHEPAPKTGNASNSMR